MGENIRVLKLENISNGFGNPNSQNRRISQNPEIKNVGPGSGTLVIRSTSLLFALRSIGRRQRPPEVA